MIIRRGQAPWSIDMHLDRKSGCTVLIFRDIQYALESNREGKKRQMMEKKAK
jgi:hypothetical protein